MARQECDYLDTHMVLLDSSTHYSGTSFTIGDLNKYDIVLIIYQIADLSMGTWVIPKGSTLTYKESTISPAYSTYKGTIKVTITNWSTGSIKVENGNIAGYSSSDFSVRLVYGIKF